MDAQHLGPLLAGTLALTLGPWLTAQGDFGASKEFLPRLRIWADVGIGTLDHDTWDSDLDGDDTATLLEIGVEGFSDSGIGGGVRLGILGSDDGMLDDAGEPDVTASAVDLYLHVSQRWAHDRFAMPLRLGLLFNSYDLAQDTNTFDETIQFDSLGFRAELEPEFLLSDWDGAALTAGSRLSLGSAWTECSTDPSTFEADSATLFYGVDVGLRLRTGMGSFHLGWVLRGQSMDESEVVGNMVYRGYDESFTGLMLGGGIFF